MQELVKYLEERQSKFKQEQAKLDETRLEDNDDYLQEIFVRGRLAEIREILKFIEKDL